MFQKKSQISWQFSANNFSWYLIEKIPLEIDVIHKEKRKISAFKINEPCNKQKYRIKSVSSTGVVESISYCFYQRTAFHMCLRSLIFGVLMIKTTYRSDKLIRDFVKPKMRHIFSFNYIRPIIFSAKILSFLA